MKEKFYRFMSGRYGDDQLNRFLFVMEFVFLFLSLFIRSRWVTVVFFVCFFLYFFRAMSRNYAARRAENEHFVRIRSKISHRVKAIQKNFQDKQYKHFVCPQCAQIIRVPRGRGEVEITCPSCRRKFSGKV